MDHKKTYREWLDSEMINEEYRKELISIQNDDVEIKERFYKNLEFGTGGLRGIIGIGTNRINIYTVRKATQGLADFINASTQGNDIKSVAIAYDSRHFSDVFAKEAALVLAANNIRAYLFDSLRPTPELSFAVRYLECDAGIVVTASHNPPEYNGYKVYGSDGGQITLETANAIISKINCIDIFDDVKTSTVDDAMESELLVYIEEDVDREYLKHVRSLAEGENKLDISKDLKIVYTPLHGTGLMPIERVLSELGYSNVHIVQTQKEPDGRFPTVKSPNPEERETLKIAIDLAEEIGADIAFGTDPDADRIGVAVRDKDGAYKLLTGNQIGALLIYYLVNSKKHISNREAVVKTIVTSDLGANIAKSYGATVYETLTGFKFIGEKIKEFEETKEQDFLFGYEESYGYLAGTFVRDKDAVIASVLIAEMTAFYKEQDKTLLDVIDMIYNEFGYYNDSLKSYTFKGAEGIKKIHTIVDQFRNEDEIIQEFPNLLVIEDYKIQTRTLMDKNQVERINLPSSNVIKMHLSDGSWFAIRPSGTEPKLKAYFSTVSEDKYESLKNMKKLVAKVSNLIEG